VPILDEMRAICALSWGGLLALEGALFAFFLYREDVFR
jgi:hypothetical protein